MIRRAEAQGWIPFWSLPNLGALPLPRLSAASMPFPWLTRGLRPPAEAACGGHARRATCGGALRWPAAAQPPRPPFEGGGAQKEISTKPQGKYDLSYFYGTEDFLR